MKIIVCTLLLFAQVAIAQVSNTPPQSDPKARAIMDEFFAHLTEVLVLSFDINAFSSEKNKKDVSKSLKLLSEKSAALSDHAKSRDQTFRFITNSLMNDARAVSKRYDQGQYLEARYLLHNMTENCVSCHNRLPSNSRPPSADAFFKNIDRKNLDAFQVAQLQTALRQFPEAAKSYESAFKDSKIKSNDFSLNSAVVDYLKLQIRVLSDVKKPITVLESILTRRDLPQFLKSEMQSWLADLKKYSSAKPIAKGKELEAARVIIARAQSKIEYPLDRSVIVQYIYASTLLNTFVSSEKNTDPKQLSEAYYLLGLTEIVIGRSYWLSQAEFFLETSIRIAPKSPFARKAYALLEKQIHFNYSGSSGMNIPEDVMNNLNELRTML